MRPKTPSSDVPIDVQPLRVWRRVGYQEDAGREVVLTTSPGTDLAVSHTFGPYEEDTYIRAIGKAHFWITAGTNARGTLELYDTTNTVQRDFSVSTLSITAYLEINASPVMWEGLLVAGATLRLTVRGYKSSAAAVTVDARQVKACFEVCKF